MMGRTLATLILICLSAPAFAQARPSSCTRENVEPRAYLDCLTDAQKASETALDNALKGALAAISARAELQGVQRTRWAALINEAQGRFVHWRNFECQSIAPYEGGGATRTVGGRLGGIGVLEQRLVCLTTFNTQRAEDLGNRYKPPAGWSPPPETVTATKPEAAAPAARAEPAEMPMPSGPVRIITP